MSSSPQAQEIQAIFDRIAPKYDQLNNGLSLGLHWIWKQMAVKWSEARPGSVCLDVCCGSGDVAQLLARQVGTTGKIYGVDFSSQQLAIAQARAPHLPITWLEGNALHLSFPDQYFDAVTMSYGLRNVVDISASLQEIRRVLKPGAKAAILDFNRPQNSQLRAFQQWYLDHFVVPTAQRLGLREEYAYISPSLDRFPTGSEQVDLALQAGFEKAVHYAIAGGMMGVLVGVAPLCLPSN